MNMNTEWRVGESDGGLTIVVSTSSDGLREIVAKPYGIESMSAARVAQLIAMAPDLLAAVKQALPLVDAYRRVAGGDGDVTAALMRFLINRAEGME